MVYIENPDWISFYKELDKDKRFELFNEISKSCADDGADKLRKTLIEWRYTDPKKPGKRVDNGVWEMLVIPAHMRGFVASKRRVGREIERALKNFGINDENMNNPILKSAVYWELRNVAKRFYEACDSPRYARKLFGMMESSWDEKLSVLSKDVWKMSEGVPMWFNYEKQMQVFSDAMRDELYEFAPQAKSIYNETKIKFSDKKLPIVF